MKKRVVFLVDEALLELFDKKAGSNRTDVLVQLIRDFVEVEAKPDDMNAKDRAVVYENEVKISKVVNDLALKALKSRDRNIFQGLTDSELAKLVLSQLPKPKDVDEDLHSDMLSLRNALEKLPSIEDVTLELSKAKMQINKLLHEREIQQTVIGGLRKRLNRDCAGSWSSFREAFNMALSKARELSKEAEARDLDWGEFKVLVVPDDNNSQNN